jgi:predicted alpha/beta hydrolase family esterase
VTVLFVDGWYGPGKGDWQSVWLRSLPDAARVGQDDWDVPEIDAWVRRLDEAVARCAAPPILVGYSLGCPTVLHWVARGGTRAEGALFVAPADVESRREPGIHGFAPIPRLRLPFPSILAASANDDWMKPARAAELARAWGSTLRNVGEVGHLTAEEGYGYWPMAEKFLEELVSAPRD